MRRLYQLLHERAISLSGIWSTRSRDHTIRTEVTVERRERILFCGHLSPDGAACPLCGQALPAAVEEQMPSGSQTGALLEKKSTRPKVVLRRQS